MSPTEELIRGLYATFMIYGIIFLRNMKFVWQVPYVPVIYMIIGAMIGGVL